MPHPLVTQLRFTRSEWVRGLKSVTAEEAARRFGPINPIAWMIGHLAWQEQLYWAPSEPQQAARSKNHFLTDCRPMKYLFTRTPFAAAAPS